MEMLSEKYGFSREQMEDIKKVLMDSLQEILPTILKDITPTLVQNFMKKAKTENEEIEEISISNYKICKHFKFHQ